MGQDTTPDGLADTTPSSSSRDVPDVLVSGTKLTEVLTVVRLLGRGGQGDVYEVEDQSSGEHHAIKLLSADLTKDDRFVRRLEREAVTASAIDHPHVTRIYGLEHAEDGSVFLRMELLTGRSLDALLKKGPMPIEVACGLVTDMAKGLAAAHQIGVIHRDIKPQNVFVAKTEAGPVAKIMDFGIAKAEAKWDLTALTSTGMLIGTPAYMSPEQILTPDQIDNRTDVYSLGLVFYEMLTGRRAFQAKEVAQVLVMQAQRPPADVRSLRPDLPRPVARVVMRCLEKRPYDRFETMSDLVRAIEEAKSAPDRPAPVTVLDRRPPPPPPRPLPVPAPPKRRTSWFVVSAVVGLFVALAIGALTWSADDTLDASMVRTVELPPPRAAPAPVPAPPPAPKKTTGTVDVTSEPRGAAVFLGGAILGTTPLEVTLAAGREHAVELRHQGYAPQEVRLRVDPGERRSRRVVLVPASNVSRSRRQPIPRAARAPPLAPPAPAASHGWARINTKPWTEVYFEDRPIGVTPIGKAKLPTGKVMLRFVNREQNIEVRRTIVVRPGELTKVMLNLGS